MPSGELPESCSICGVELNGYVAAVQDFVLDEPRYPDQDDSRPRFAHAEAGVYRSDSDLASSKNESSGIRGTTLPVP